MTIKGNLAFARTRWGLWQVAYPTAIAAKRSAVNDLKQFILRMRGL